MTDKNGSILFTQKILETLKSAVTNKKLIFSVFVILAIVFVGRKFFVQGKNDQVIQTTVKRGTITQTNSLSGTAQADEHVVLLFQTAGRLSWVGVKQGDYVKKFQTLATLDQRSVKKNLQKYLNTYIKERNDFDQTGDDNPTVLTDTIKRTLENAQYDLNNAVLDVELQNLSVEYSRLYTPIAGIITRIDTPFAGINITPVNAVFEVTNPETIYFEASADQSEVVHYRQDMHGTITLDPYSDINIPTTIKDISFTPKQGETGAVYTIKMNMNTTNKNMGYRVGMTGDANFVTSKKDNVLYISLNFVNEDENGQKYVFTSSDKKKRANVSTGLETDDTVEITKGLHEGEIVYD